MKERDREVVMMVVTRSGRVVVMMMMYIIGTFERNEWIN